VDVAGLRFLPTLTDLPVNAYSSAWRVLALVPNQAADDAQAFA
jgi:hypothetical protein